MIKIKTKIIDKDTTNEYVGVDYKTKNSSAYEHLVVIKHLLNVLIEDEDYTKEELLKLVKLYLN